MPIDTNTAVDVARAAGLTLADARALAALANTEAEARQIAAKFTGDPKRQFLGKVLGQVESHRERSEHVRRGNLDEFKGHRS